MEKYCPGLLNEVEIDDELTDEDSDGEQPPKLEVEELNDFI